MSDNLIVIGMVNVVLFHWFWYVLEQPLTYVQTSQGQAVEQMPPLPVPSWVHISFRICTQEWAYGAFAVAAAWGVPPQDLQRFTRRDLVVLVLYLYIGVGPLLVGLVAPTSWKTACQRAETAPRWFLLVLLVGKVVLVSVRPLGVTGRILCIALLLAIALVVPPCFGDLWSIGGAYLLPTNCWPSCTSCLWTPREAASLLIYVVAAISGPPTLDASRSKTQPWHVLLSRSRLQLAAAASLFGLLAALALILPGQTALEGGETEQSFAARALGLVMLLFQTGALVWVLDSFPNLHLKWQARWALGSYIWNINFPDFIQISPEVRREIILKLQVGGPVLSGILTWTALLLPTVLFMTIVAPVLQTLFIVGPFGVACRVPSWWHIFRLQIAEHWPRTKRRGTGAAEPLLLIQ